MAKTRERPRCGSAPQLLPDGLTPDDGGGGVRTVTEMEGCAHAAIVELEHDLTLPWDGATRRSLPDYYFADEEAFLAITLLPPPTGEPPLTVNGGEPRAQPPARASDASGGADAPMSPPAGGTAAAAGAGLPAAPRSASQAHASRAPHNAGPAGVLLVVPRVGVVPVKDLIHDLEGRYGYGLCRNPVVRGGRVKGSTFEVDSMPGLPLCAGVCRRNAKGTYGLLCRPCFDWASREPRATEEEFWEDLYVTRAGACPVRRTRGFGGKTLRRV